MMTARIAALAAFLGVPAWTQDFVPIPPQSYTTTVSIAPDGYGGYEVVFVNKGVNGADHNKTYDLAHGEFRAPFDFRYTAGDDEITVRPPEGWACEPVTCEIAVPEVQQGIVYLFRGQDVGM